jgi:beta-lactamase class A
MDHGPRKAVMKLALLFLVVACTRGAAPVSHTPAETQLAWVLDVLAHGGVVDRATVEAHFDPVFLRSTSADKLVQAFVGLSGHLHGMATLRVTQADGFHLVLHGAVPETKFALIVEVAPSQRISKLDVQPDVTPPPATMTEAIARLRALAPKAQLLVAEIRDGKCVAQHATNPDAELALGSAFKLYVLLGLVDRINAGDAQWGDELAVREDWMSLPGGVTQNDPVGTKLSLRTLAERMISISDNTAADYVLYTVGRTRVEAAVRESGHAEPVLDVPFLGTRELFWLKTALSPQEVEHYVALPAEARRAVLDGLAGKHPTVGDWKEPRFVDQIEWFASSADLCRLASTLLARAASQPVLLDVLAKNPALPKSAAWSYVGFKGGSEPGVINATWLLRRRDDRWFVVTLGLNGPAPIDEGEVVGLAHGIINLLANETSP